MKKYFQVEKVLAKKKAEPGEVLLLTVDGENNVVFLRKEGSS